MKYPSRMLSRFPSASCTLLTRNSPRPTRETCLPCTANFQVLSLHPSMSCLFPGRLVCNRYSVGRSCLQIPSSRLASRSQFIRTKTRVLSTFRMNTCKSVSKQRTLSTFRMNTCEKGGDPLSFLTPRRCAYRVGGQDSFLGSQSPTAAWPT